MAPAVAVLTALLLLVTVGAGAPVFGLRGGLDFVRRQARRIAARDVESEVRAALDAEILGGSSDSARQLEAIEAKLWHRYEALPKDRSGHLAPPALRHLVQGYFAEVHGWLIKGLEPHGMLPNVSQVHEASILQDRAPALVEAFVEARERGRGASFADAAAAVAALERLISSESVALLGDMFTLKKLSELRMLDETDLHTVLRMFLLAFSSPALEQDKLRLLKAFSAQSGKGSDDWLQIVNYEQDAVGNYMYEHRHTTNPFVPPQYSFGAAAKIVDQMVLGYGKWQQDSCLLMKEHLSAMDKEGAGRVALDDFWAPPLEGASFRFAESREYLREIGALDETVRGQPRVLVANYLTGPSNCLSDRSYYSICCLNECGALTGEIERMLRAPSASPGLLLGMVANLSSPTVDGPRQLPPILEEKLHEIAARHDGKVPLHGRLFTQWMHYAFPLECPYPKIMDNASVMTMDFWKNRDQDYWRQATTAQKKPRRNLIAAGRGQEEEQQPLPQWTNDEVLPVQQPLGPARSAVGMAVRVAMLGAAFVAIFRTALSGLTAAVAVRGQRKAVDEKEPLP